MGWTALGGSACMTSVGNKGTGAQMANVKQRRSDLKAIAKKNGGARSGNGTADQERPVGRSGTTPTLLMVAFLFAAGRALLDFLAPCISKLMQIAEQ